LDENIAILRAEFEYMGVSVILACRECIQTSAKRNRKKE